MRPHRHTLYILYITLYIFPMPKRYSIAEARKHLPGIVHEAESGAEIELTRHGKPVAVVVSVSAYEQARGARPRFRQAYESFSRRYPLEEVGIDEDFFDSLRDRGAGRKVRL